MSDYDQSSEKKVIDDYVKSFCLEECLDEVINTVVTERPTNPYMKIAQAMEAKTMPEIIDINLIPIITIKGGMGVKALVTTNISTFEGITAYGNNVSNSISTSEELKNYSAVLQPLREALLSMDPRKSSLIDEKLSKVVGLDTCESLAISMACCRAGARHKGIPLHQHINELTNDKNHSIRIPIPIISVVSRAIGSSGLFQDVQLVPISILSFESSLAKIITISRLIMKNELIKKNVISESGCPVIEANNIATVIKIVHSLLEENGLSDDLRLSVNYKADKMISLVESTIMYNIDDPPTQGAAVSVAAIPNPAKAAKGAAPPIADVPIAKTGQELVDWLNMQWHEIEIVSMVNPVSEKDNATLTLMKKKIYDTTHELKSTHSKKMKYAMSGVGGDATCSLQVVIDGLSFDEIHDVETKIHDLPYNCVLIRLSGLESISRALHICRKARKLNLSVSVGCNTNNNNDAQIGNESIDTFLSDFCVGIGSGQLMGGGLFMNEFNNKYNRIADLINEHDRIPFAGAKFR
eukprot:gene4191-5962_t